MARTLVTIAGDPQAWGRAWLTPTNPPLTIRQLAHQFSEVMAAPAPKVTAIPYPALWTAGIFSPLVRELRTTRYQFDRPFIVDSTLATETFGIEPTPIEKALLAAAAYARPLR